MDEGRMQLEGVYLGHDTSLDNQMPSGDIDPELVSTMLAEVSRLNALPQALIDLAKRYDHAEGHLSESSPLSAFSESDSHYAQQAGKVLELVDALSEANATSNDALRDFFDTTTKDLVEGTSGFDSHIESVVRRLLGKEAVSRGIPSAFDTSRLDLDLSAPAEAIQPQPESLDRLPELFQMNIEASNTLEELHERLRALLTDHGGVLTPPERQALENAIGRIEPLTSMSPVEAGTKIISVYQNIDSYIKTFPENWKLRAQVKKLLGV